MLMWLKGLGDRGSAKDRAKNSYGGTEHIGLQYASNTSLVLIVAIYPCLRGW
jgi:hypothetical protein